MLFAFIQRNIKYYKNNLDYISLHNYFTTYTISILQLSTGLRPKVGFFEDINRFNLDDKTVIICDKGEKSRRLIKLSKSAHTQLIEYIKFIKILTKRTYYQDRNVSEELTKKIDGTSNLLSLIERDNASKKRYKISSNTLRVFKDFTQGRFPFPTNWHRHYLRSEFEKAEFNAELVDLFFDHNSNLDHKSSIFSSIKTNDLDKLADFIENKIFQSLDIKTLKSPLRE